MKFLFLLFIPFTLLGDSQTKIFEAGSVSAIQIQNYLGPISVKASKHTKVTIKRFDFVPSCSLVSKLVNGTIILKATREEKLFSWADVKSCKVEISLELPPKTLMFLKSRKGSIKVSGMKGQLTFHVDQGQVQVDGATSEITGVVKRGNISVSDQGGNISLKAFRGDISVRYSKAPFSAELDLIAKKGNIDLFLIQESLITGTWTGRIVHSDFKRHKTSLFNIHLEAPKGNISIKKIMKER